MFDSNNNKKALYWGTIADSLGYGRPYLSQLIRDLKTTVFWEEKEKNLKEIEQRKRKENRYEMIQNRFIDFIDCKKEESLNTILSPEIKNAIISYDLLEKDIERCFVSIDINIKPPFEMGNFLVNHTEWYICNDNRISINDTVIVFYKGQKYQGTVKMVFKAGLNNAPKNIDNTLRIAYRLI